MCDADSLGLNHQQLLKEITTLLETCAQPSDANALQLNQELQRRLEQVRARMQHLLKLVRARYARNEEILIRRQKPRSRGTATRHGAGAGAADNYGISGAALRGGTFHFKGNLYFRDVDGRSCPNNEDYNRRCATEMFPTDFDMRSKHVWTLLDKRNVVAGIKQQLLEHATYQNQALTAPSTLRKRKKIDLHTQTLVSLMDTVDSSFSIDWNQISTLDVEHRHSSYSCEAMWLVYLHPRLNREGWTAEEDAALIAAAKANKLQNWQAIAEAVQHRSDYQCFIRMHTTLRFNMEPTRSYKWADGDNERLRLIVEKNTVNGVTNWSQVVEHFPGRSRSTLIGRYMYVLHPSISHAPFTPKEDLMLYAAVEEYNGKFNCFPRTLFPNRSLAQLRTRYHNVLAQRNKTDPWSVEDDRKLMDFVTAHGSSQWVDCANYLGNHTRTSCRTRSLVIKRFLEQHPNATIDDIPRRKVCKNTQVTAENWTQRLQEWQDDPDSLLSEAKSTLQPKAKRRKRQQSCRKPSYVDTLRGFDVQIFEYFKYAYNLQLQSPAAPMPLPKHERNLHLVANALRFRAPTETTRSSTKHAQLIQSVSLPKQLNRCYSTMLQQLPPTGDSESTLLPPNWSTMMGFRSICILSVDCRNHADAGQESSQAMVNYDESHAAVQLFRQRLRALFYRTTLLSRLETSVFEQLPAALKQSPRPEVSY
ncbi:hypothetical protein KR222_006931, partial [Zaprionus bogoriensis]